MFLVPLSRQAHDIGRSLDRLFDENIVDRLFAPSRAESGARSPALEVSESERAYTVKLEMPGVPKEQMRISVEGRRVTVEGSASQQHERKEGDRVVYTERTASSYARSFTLPGEVNEAESAAKLEDGVLTLTLAKRGATMARQINIS